MTLSAAQGSRLASVRPANTSDTLAFTATLDTEVTRVYVCNTSANARTFRLHHVNAGGSVSLDNALYYDKALAANDSFELFSDAPNSGLQLKTGDMLYVRSSNANDLAFNIYGVTADIAPYTR